MDMLAVPELAKSRSTWLLSWVVVAASMLPLTARAETSVYLGASAGQSAIKGSAAEIDAGFFQDSGYTASGTALDKTSTGWKAYAGLRFNRYLALEAGYADLGKATFNTTIVAAPPGTVPVPPFPLDASATADGEFLSGIVEVPFSQSFSLFVKAGGFRSTAHYTEIFSETGVTRLSRSTTRTDLDYGAGFRWMFSRIVGLRLEWEDFKNIGYGIGGRTGRDVYFISAGLTLQF
jgi:opacity protein-like surface antigen